MVKMALIVNSDGIVYQGDGCVVKPGRLAPEVDSGPFLRGEIVVRGSSAPAAPPLAPLPSYGDTVVRDYGGEKRVADFVVKPGTCEAVPTRIPRMPQRVLLPPIIHDVSPRSAVVVNLGDTDGPSAPPKPWLGPAPISVGGPHRYQASFELESEIAMPEGTIHGGLPEEETENPGLLVDDNARKPVEILIHDFECQKTYRTKMTV